MEWEGGVFYSDYMNLGELTIHTHIHTRMYTCFTYIIHLYLKA